MRFIVPVILRRHAHDRFSEVVREWEGATAVLLGGGHSMTPEQVALVRGGHVIAINNSYLLAPWADVCYFGDATWWAAHKDRPEFVAFAGQKCSIQDSMDKITDDAVHILRNRDYPHHGEGLSLKQDTIVTGRNGGFQALNLAILAGCKTVILLGIDGRESKEGKTHWHDGHRKPTPAAAYEAYRRSFSAAENAILAAGVRVINASPNSAIDSFEKLSLEEALCIEHNCPA